jgi:PAS domain S-box-containing protein
MKDEQKTREQLLEEFLQLRRRQQELEAGAYRGKLGATADGYKLIFELFADAVFIAGPDLRIVDFNQQALTMFGYSDKEMMNMALFELVPGESRNLIDKEEEKSEGGADGYLLTEALGVRKDRSVFPIEIRCKRITLAGTEYKVCFTRDITERKKTEARLQQGEAYFRSLLEKALDLIVVLEADSRVRFISPSLESVFGLAPGSILRENLSDLLSRVHPEDRDRVLSFLDSAFLEEDSISVEFRGGDKPDYLRTLEVVTNNLLGDPSIGGLVLTVRDVTLRKRGEESLRQKEETLRALVNGITDTAILAKPDGTVVIINDEGAGRFGAKPERMIGTNIFDWLPSPIKEGRKEQMAEAVRTGKAIYFLDRRDDVCMESNVVPVWSGDELKYVVIFARDVSDHIRLEEALTARTQELEAFGHTVSHDLRNPLSIIQGYIMTAKAALKEGNAEILSESLDGMLKAVLRMEKFIESLLEYARAGIPDGKAERIEPRRIIQSLLEQYGDMLQGTHAEIEIAGELPPVKVDAMRFEQVMANLIDNALKFSAGNKEPRIEIGAERDDHNIVFRVSDNGVGIESHFWEIVFEPFKRFATTETPGLGIGLATVRRAVSGWGGEVWIESVPGKGSNCYFTVPAADP